MTFSDLDATIGGIIGTVCDRLDLSVEDLLAWVEQLPSPEAVAEIADGGFELEDYFAVLDEYNDDELDALGWASYEKTIGPAIDRVEDAFLAWREERLLTLPVERGARGRLSGLSERVQILA
jgi:hypothetical protein